jgi:hypothetical protein
VKRVFHVEPLNSGGSAAHGRPPLGLTAVAHAATAAPSQLTFVAVRHSGSAQ